LIHSKKKAQYSFTHVSENRGTNKFCTGYKAHQSHFLQLETVICSSSFSPDRLHHLYDTVHMLPACHTAA
jgi:hypothetical protein